MRPAPFPKLFRYFGACLTPVRKVGTKQNVEGSRVMRDVKRIRSAVRKTMVGIDLNPFLRLGMPMINIVPVSLFYAAIYDWSLRSETRITPILIVREYVGDSHCEDNVPGEA